jgi:S1-C subfamily serine protease
MAPSPLRADSAKADSNNDPNAERAALALAQESAEPETPTARPNSAPKTHYVAGQPMAENRIAEIAAQTAPSVVNVESLSDAPTNEELLRNEQSKRPFDIAPFPRPNPLSPAPSLSRKRTRPLTSGSGLIVSPNGYVITNNHLLRPNTQMKVTLTDQRIFKAQVVGRDRFTDLAMLKIDANNLPVVPFGNSKEVRPGDWAIAIGNPLGFDHTVTLGIVSAINRTLADLNNHVELIQTDAAINPGNSGGPLLNIHGEVIGLNSAIRNDAQNIGFAIPVDVLQQVSDGLIKNGSIARPYLGIFMRDATNRATIDGNLPKNGHAVFILRVIQGSPAEHTGLLAGDQIDKINGVSVRCGRDVRRIVRNLKPQDTIEITIVRNGTSETKKLTIGNYPKDE